MLNGRPLLGWNDPDAKPVDPNERPRFLRELLEKEEWQYQRTNILKVLDIYKSGKEFAPGERIWLVDGEVVSGLEEAVSKGGVKWLEVSFYYQSYIGLQSPLLTRCFSALCVSL